MGDRRVCLCICVRREGVRREGVRREGVEKRRMGALWFIQAS